MLEYDRARTSEDFEAARQLFRLYADSLAVDLCFQNFEDELIHIADQYNAPTGALILARDGSKSVGCGGVRKLEERTAELKRMYVLPEYRGLHAGKHILMECLAAAASLGYERIRLDTLPEMKKAQDLYRSAGFHEIGSYRPNPVQGTIYMEKALTLK